MQSPASSPFDADRYAPGDPWSAPRRPRRLTAAWAQHLDEVRQAQRLRYAVFTGELGATLHTPLPGHDIDAFDDHCEHLLVRDATTQDVIGTCRVLTPQQACRLGTGYCDTEFDLAPLQALRPRMAELGRSCVHAQHRQGSVILALWSALAAFMLENRLETMLGCASMSLQARGDPAAAAAWRRTCKAHRIAAPYRVRPRLPLPPAADGMPFPVGPSALIMAYLRLGARVLGPPAWDPGFNTADLPMLLRVGDLPPRYRRGPALG